MRAKKYEKTEEPILRSCVAKEQRDGQTNGRTELHIQ